MRAITLEDRCKGPMGAPHTEDVICRERERFDDSEDFSQYDGEITTKVPANRLQGT